MFSVFTYVTYIYSTNIEYSNDIMCCLGTCVANIFNTTRKNHRKAVSVFHDRCTRVSRLFIYLYILSSYLYILSRLFNYLV